MCSFFVLVVVVRLNILLAVVVVATGINGDGYVAGDDDFIIVFAVVSWGVDKLL